MEDFAEYHSTSQRFETMLDKDLELRWPLQDYQTRGTM